MTLNSAYGEQGTGGAGVPTKQWTHVTVSILYQTATIFFNGTLVGYASGVWLTPFQTCNTTDVPAQNTIGLSQFTSIVLKARCIFKRKKENKFFSKMTLLWVIECE